MKLPTYDRARENVTLGLANPLEKFIFENEPFETRDAAIWRRELTEAILYSAEIVDVGLDPEYVDSTMELPLDAEPE